MSEAVAFDRRVYVGTYSRVYGLQANNGEILWEFLPRQSRKSEKLAANKATPVIAGDDLYYADFSGIIYCLDRHTGAVRWENRDIRSSDDSLLFWNDRLYGRIYRARSVNGGPRKGYACLTRDGELIWTFETEGDVYTSQAALHGRDLIFGDGAGFAYGVDASDGSLDWRFDAKEHVQAQGALGPLKTTISGSPFIANGIAVLRASGLHLVGLEASTGELMWVYECSEPVKNVACGGDTVFHTTYGGECFAVNLETGELKWSAKNEEAELGDIAAKGGLVVGDYYFCGFNSSRKLAAFDTRTGEVVWTFQGKGRGGFSSTPIFVNGRLYMGQDHGQFYCFEPAAE